MPFCRGHKERTYSWWEKKSNKWWDIITFLFHSLCFPYPCLGREKITYTNKNSTICRASLVLFFPTLNYVVLLQKVCTRAECKSGKNTKIVELKGNHSSLKPCLHWACWCAHLISSWDYCLRYVPENKEFKMAPNCIWNSLHISERMWQKKKKGGGG